MGVRGFVVTVGLVLVLTGCGDDGGDGETADAAAAPSPVAPAPGGGSATPLRVVIGSAADPEAFELSLQDDAGQPVTSLPAGDYEFAVDDRSALHNAHLTGAGVDERTSVPEKEAATWSVSLTAGGYELVCDPHARGMRVDLTVT